MPIDAQTISTRLKEELQFLDEYAEDEDLIAYIIEEINTKNIKQLRTPKLIHLVCQYHDDIEEKDLIKFIRQKDRPRREVADYSRREFSLAKRPRGNTLYYGADSERVDKYAIYPREGMMTSPVKLFISRAEAFTTLRTPSRLILSPGGNTAKGPKNTPYKLTILGSTVSLYEEEDTTERDEIEFDEEHLPSIDEIKQKFPELLTKPSSFDFIVTKDSIEARIGKKRSCSQRSVTGYSAKEFFEAMGVEIQEQTYGSMYHLAHRQGHSLGGQQDINNLDVATAGSNYHTLFLIEAPLTELLTKNKLETDTVTVHGDIKYHERIPIPQEITYRLTWGNGRELCVKIYPLDHRKPTIIANKLAKMMFETQRTPASYHKPRSARTPMKYSPEREAVSERLAKLGIYRHKAEPPKINFEDEEDTADNDPASSPDSPSK